jgi:hypothetical protein
MEKYDLKFPANRKAIGVKIQVPGKQQTNKKICELKQAYLRNQFRWGERVGEQKCEFLYM